MNIEVPYTQFTSPLERDTLPFEKDIYYSPRKISIVLSMDYKTAMRKIKAIPTDKNYVIDSNAGGGKPRYLVLGLAVNKFILGIE